MQGNGTSRELKLGQLLIEEGLITQGQLEEALRNQVIYGVRLGSSLVEMGYVEEEDLIRLLSRKIGAPCVGSRELSSVPKEVIRGFSRALVIKYHVIPFKRERNRLGLAMTDPGNYRAIEEIAFITGQVVEPYIAPDVNISRAQARYYRFRKGEARYQQVSDLRSRRVPAGTGKPSIAVPAVSASGERLNVHIPAEFEEFAGGSVTMHPHRGNPEKYDPRRVAGDLAAASSREEVADLLIRHIGREFLSGALFIVRNRLAVGWRGVRDGEAYDFIVDLNLDLNKPSVLKDVVETRTFSLGTLNDTPQNRQILRLLGMPVTGALFVVPITLRGKVVALALTAADMDELGSRLSDMQTLARKAAMTFEMLIIKSKILKI